MFYCDEVAGESSLFPCRLIQIYRYLYFVPIKNNNIRLLKNRCIFLYLLYVLSSLTAHQHSYYHFQKSYISLLMLYIKMILKIWDILYTISYFIIIQVIYKTHIHHILRIIAVSYIHILQNILLYCPLYVNHFVGCTPLQE